MEIYIEPLQTPSERGLHRHLDEMAMRAQDPRRELASIIKSFISIEQRQFSTEGTYSGGWAELAESTRENKARSGFDQHILQATHRLRNSLTRPTDPDSDIRIINAHTLRLSTRVFYAVFHARGTRRMPARPPIDINIEIRHRWLRKLQHFIVHGDI